MKLSSWKNSKFLNSQFKKSFANKALKQGLKPIVVINKLDKADQRANEVLDETFDFELINSL